MAIKNNRIKLLFIFALFIGPLVAASIWYYSLPPGYNPISTVNNGTLLDPILPLEEFSNTNLNGKLIDKNELTKKWTLVYLLDSRCEQACSKVLYNTRQVRIALGKNTDRVHRFLIINDSSPEAIDKKTQAVHPDLTVLQANPSTGLEKQIRNRVKNENFETNSVYLIDPLGNLMMQFPPALNPKLILKDLEKLLKLSNIG